MFCTNCGNELPDGSNFCNKCGEKVNTLPNKKPITNQAFTKISYEGKVYKCPNCGDSIDSFASKCPSCGSEIHNISSVDSVKEFERQLRQIEADRKERGSLDKFVSVMSGCPTSEIDIKIANQIKSFPIPNTKEDIFEFLILAASNYDPSAYVITSKSLEQYHGGVAIADAWDSKFNQAYQKALLSFSNDPRLHNIKEMYDRKQQQKEIEKKQYDSKQRKACISVLLLLLAYVFIMILMAYFIHLFK